MTRSVDSAENPLISVVMPVYNAERYVADAIRSILAQTYENFEFIIVDDGSTDGSVNIVREFAAQDARIRPYFLEHQGRKRTFQAGITKARGDFIARMDSDDMALPERFSIQLPWMRARGVEICGSCVKEIGMADGLLWFPETHEAIRNELIFRTIMLFPTVLMPIHIARSIPDREAAATEEYPTWTYLVLRYRMGNVPQILLKHRSHDQQVHVLDAPGFLADLCRFRQPYFHALFPEATEADYASVARVAQNEPSANLADLERAGAWLVRLAQLPDNFLRQRMAARWYIACQKSAHWGLKSYHLYQQYAPQFDILLDERASRKLWLQCAFRLQAGSRGHHLLSFVEQKWTRTLSMLQGKSS
jgi:glycosyltransferase involved in cell wall biosynthesis